MIVTAFGVTRETKALGYATSTVGGEDLVKTASPNFASAIYGKAAGVRIAAAPGGAISAVNITVRGINSITGRNQPLIVVNGIPIRDGEVSNNNYWGDQRIRGNGLLDVNPEDIENISILKGASAAALYGSEAVNGVVLITTKSGKGVKGFKVDAFTSYSIDKIAYLPRYQDVRGPGFPLNYSNAGQDEDMFLTVDGQRALVNATVNFGPKFDGQPILSWDGVTRPYEAQDGFASLFQTAHSKVNSVSVSYSGDNGSATRLGFTRQDNEGISLNSKNEKNIVSLSNNFNLGKNYAVEVNAQYINQTTKNRPYMIDRMINNFTGMMTRFDNGEW